MHPVPRAVNTVLWFYPWAEVTLLAASLVSVVRNKLIAFRSNEGAVRNMNDEEHSIRVGMRAGSRSGWYQLGLCT